jgi:hypothetical protein
LTRVVATRGELLAIRIGELEGFAIGASKGVNQRIEAKIACESKGCDDVGGSYEGVRGGICVITAREVAVVRRDNCDALADVDFVSGMHILEFASPFLTS